MTNAEKYKKEIFQSKDYCSFIIEKVLKPNGIDNCVSKIGCEKCRLLTTIWLMEEYREPEIDWSKIPVDTAILVRNREDTEWKKRHFAKYEDKKVYTYCYGNTSWTNNGEDTVCWNFAKLPEVK